MLKLRYQTPDAWCRHARSDLGALLLDHAHLEKKAAGTAVTLLFRYPDETALQEPLAALERWVDDLPGLLTYGRQGLFAHDNTHHALAMAYAAADCLRDGRFDRTRWAAARASFAAHVVED